MKKIIVYHDTEALARRSRPVGNGELVAYRSINDWNETINKKYDKVIDSSTPLKPKKK